VLAVLTFVVGIARGEPWHEMFLAAIARAVGAIPEGLPAAVTITLAIGVARMARPPRYHPQAARRRDAR
jgi:cation-transporting ATPase F